MSIRLVAAGALATVLLLPLVPPASASDSLSLSARSRHHHHYRHHGDSRAAMRMFGMVAGTIAGIAAEQERRDYYRDRYRYGYYGYGRPYGYYGPGPYYPY